MSKKQLTLDDVKRVALALISLNGTTTTKDVKDQLRAEDYFAKQHIVSDMMATLHDIESWSFIFNGTFREYTLNSAVAPIVAGQPTISQQLASHVGAAIPIVDPNVAQPGLILVTTGANSYITRDGQVIDAIDNPTAGDWECRDVYLTKDKLYFNGNVSKDRTRYAYCKIVGIDHSDARIARFK